MQVRTRNTSEANAKPLPVAGLRAVLVSPISRFNAVNLLWRTNCESDVSSYEIHRSSQAGLIARIPRHSWRWFRLRT